jgi:hypothetical protein
MTEGLTPTQGRILSLLSDGRPHGRREVHSLLGDELQPLSHVQRHISVLRKRLEPRGETIVCELRHRRQVCYRWVALKLAAGSAFGEP